MTFYPKQLMREYSLSRQQSASSTNACAERLLFCQLITNKHKMVEGRTKHTHIHLHILYKLTDHHS